MTNLGALKEWIVVCNRCLQEHNDIKSFIDDYIKTFPRTRKRHIQLSILIRSSMNLTSIALLAKFMVQNSMPSYLKLSVGILLRNCFMDILLGLYIGTMDDVNVDEIAEVLQIDYVKSLFEQFEVYRDKVGDIGLEEELLEHIYTLELEDNYLNYLEPNKNPSDLIPGSEREMWKTIPKKNVRTLLEDKESKNELNLRRIYEILKNSSLSECAINLYAYYKYFSQYEHFSELGFGNAIVSYDSDNINMEKSIIRLSESISLIKQQLTNK